MNKNSVGRGMKSLLAVFLMLVAVPPALATETHSAVYWDGLIATSKEAILRDPQSAVAHYNLAVGYLKKGQADIAIPLLQKAHRLDRNDPYALAALGSAYQRKGQPKLAVRAFKKALRLKPDFAKAHGNLGVAYIDQGRLDPAIRSLGKAIALIPEDAMFQYNLGVALLYRGSIRASIAAFKVSIEIDPDYANARHGLGVAYIETRRLRGAADALKDAIRLDWDQAKAHYNLGVVYQLQGDEGAAEAAYREAARLDPDYAQTQSTDEDSMVKRTAETPKAAIMDSGAVPGDRVQITRVGGVRPLHDVNRGRAVFADVMLVGEDKVLVTYQLAGFEEFCQGKSLYFQEFTRDLRSIQPETMVIDVDAEGSIFRTMPNSVGDLGDHKFTVMNDTIYMLTTVPGEPQGRLLRFDTNFRPIDDLFNDANLVRIGDEGRDDRLLDMGFGNDGTHLYAQFFEQPMGARSSDWGAQLYKVNAQLEVIAEAVVQPEQGTFVTGTSIVHVPTGASAERLQLFSPNQDYGNPVRSNIHTFAVNPSDLSQIQESTRVITDAELDVYFPTGADWNQTHQLWVVGYTQEISEGNHGSVVLGTNACARKPVRPSAEEFRELGPSFITVYDAQWRPVTTIPLNDGEYAFRVMLETKGDDIYVVYDEMDKYAWHETSQAKIEHFRIERIR